MSTAQVICVPPQYFGKVWQYAGHILLRGFHAASDTPVLATMDSIRHGQTQWWLIISDDKIVGCFLTQIIEFADDGRWVSLFALAGKGVRTWIGALSTEMDRFSAAEGARGWRFCGKKAWAHLVPGSVATGVRAPGVVSFQRAV